MNLILRYSYVILFCIMSLKLFAQNRTISGTVKDKDTNELLAYCTISSIGTSKSLGTTTDVNGKFKLTIPENVALEKLVITYIGYRTDTVEVHSTKNEYVIFLSPVLKTLNEVVVTGVSRATLIKENPIPIIVVSQNTIDQTIESNIIDVLVKNVPGLNAVKTGPNVSKPFIRGLGYNRVLTLYDGVRQEGQQWGDEHGIEVDVYNIEKAEVIKGPASLMYGSDALAGVVSLFSVMPVNTNGKVTGKYYYDFQGNNDLIGNGLRLMYGKKNWSYSLRGSYRLAKNYSNSTDGRVYNTNFNELNASASIVYTLRKGYSNLNFTLYDNLQGIPDGSRDSLSRKFTKQIYEGDNDNVKNRPIVTDEELNSYQLSPLHQHIQHYRVYNNNHYNFGKGSVDVLNFFQQGIRREYNHPSAPQQAGMYVQLNTIGSSVRYNATKFLNTEWSVGTNGMYQNNVAKDATDFPIPDYYLYDIGTYIYANWKHGRWTLSGGGRYDLRYLNIPDFYIGIDSTTGFGKQFNSSGPTSHLQFAAGEKTFKGLSYSFGSTFQLTNQISIKGNFAKGYRAPNITEFASDGLDPGAHIVYLGNRNFSPEYSFQEDIGLFGVFGDVSASVSLFNNIIQNYIYQAMLADSTGNPIISAQGNKTYQYQQSKAQLYGAEALFDYHPKQIKGFGFSNNFSVVYGYNRNVKYANKGLMGEYLPFIPPFKLLSSIEQEIKIKLKRIKKVNFKIDADYNAAQNRYLKLNDTENATKGYTLFDISVLTELNYYKTQKLQLQIQVNNLLDKAYQSNLSRLKYLEYYSNSPNGDTGIYGMGRNVCVKLIMGF